MSREGGVGGVESVSLLTSLDGLGGGVSDGLGLRIPDLLRVPRAKLVQPALDAVAVDELKALVEAEVDPGQDLLLSLLLGQALDAWPLAKLRGQSVEDLLEGVLAPWGDTPLDEQSLRLQALLQFQSCRIKM